MCGIHGIVALHADYRPRPEWVERMGQVSMHRGPDDAGGYDAAGIAFGMRRLSIIDPAGGHQPLASPDGSVQVVCNGEIYNFRQLREQLAERGYRFSTGSDSEVLVHLYAEYGDDLVDHLDGMFAFAVWDQRRSRLLIGRDRLGIKPLYYLTDQRRLVFASEIKSILEVPDVSASLDREGLDELLYLGYIAAPRTAFLGIKKLPAGALLICENSSVTIRKYWSYSSNVDANPGSEADYSQELLATMEKSVVDQMVSDVPLGAFLSGGIDSSAVVGLMARNSSRPVNTYSIGFDTGPEGAYYNELPYARQVAECFGTNHKEILVRPDVARLLPKLIWHLDEPMADSALMTTFLVAEFARRDVTVILSGVGGDELFGGYRRYLGAYYTRLFNRIPGWIRSAILKPGASLLPSDRHGRVSNLLRYLRQFVLTADLDPQQQYASYLQLFDAAARQAILVEPGGAVAGSLQAAFDRVSTDDAINGLMQVDLDTQLPDDLLLLTDKMTMAASIECRVPLLSQDLVDLSARMPSDLKVRGRTLKYILKDAVKDLLPNSIIHRSKRGFGAPMGAWLKKELRPLMHVILAESALTRRGLLNPAAVSKTIALHESGQEDYSDHLQCLVNLELWCRIYLDGETPGDIGDELTERIGCGAVE